MLRPDFLRNVTDRVEYAAEKLNQYLINRIVKRIVALYERKGDVDIIPASFSDIKKMQQAGKAYEEINAAIKEKLPKLQDEIDRAFRDSVAEASRDNEHFEKSLADTVMADIEIPKTPENVKNIGDVAITDKEKHLIESAYRRTNGTIKNLTGTTASAWQKKYIEIMDDAYNKAVHGVSMNTAISEAIDEAAKYGTRVEYPSGHTDTIEVAIARAVRTGVNQAAADMTLAKCAMIGIRHVLVSSHLGARYTDKAEPANHMSWQGQVYEINWNTPAYEKYTPDPSQENTWVEKLKRAVQKFLSGKWNRSQGDFETITGYGTGEGLCGWNCRHSFSPFLEGINVNNTEKYDSKENKRRYDDEQRQRSMERRLRAIRKSMNAKKAGMNAAESKDLREYLRTEYLQAKAEYEKGIDEYEAFCDQRRLPTLYERLKVPEVKRR